VELPQSSFCDLVPASLFTAQLGDSVVYNGETIKVLIEELISPFGPTYSHVSETRFHIRADTSDVSGIVRGAKFIRGSTVYKVVDIISRDFDTIKMAVQLS
jgi:hypothetical protein